VATFAEIADGRTDAVFEYIAEGYSANAADKDGVSLVQWCAYYGDVSAIKFLLENGATLESLGDNLGLIGACFHGHWRLCKFLIERGVDVNRPMTDTGENPLHVGLCTTKRLTHNQVLKVLLAHGANPNCVTGKEIAAGAFMRDCRTKGETPLHRAGAFGDEEAVQLLLDAGR
jgi:ankyrin repeat protein